MSDSSELIRIAVVGAGAFGRNHARVLSSLPGVELAAILDTNGSRAEEVADLYGTRACIAFDQLPQGIHAAIVAVPTVHHEAAAMALLQAGMDVLVEKPIAVTAGEGRRLTAFAAAEQRILQVGHLERFNPAVSALEQALTIPLFFEIHRLSVFTPRSLDVDVVLDLMIHDLDIVLHCTGEYPVSLEAAGISVLSPKVDIANVRLTFASGCIANLTASRVSTEQVRKLRLFQPGEYLSIDYARQDASRLSVSHAGANGNLQGTPAVDFQQLPTAKAEPLRLELEAFLESVRTRRQPRVDARQATEALQLAEDILDKITEHAAVVHRTLRNRGSA